MSNSLDPDPKWSLIWVEMVCRGYLQKTNDVIGRVKGNFYVCPESSQVAFFMANIAEPDSVLCGISSGYSLFVKIISRGNQSKMIFNLSLFFFR